MECLRALQGGDEGWDVNDAGVLEYRLRVNNTVGDNELGGKEVRVLPSWRKMWTQSRVIRLITTRTSLEKSIQEGDMQVAHE